MEQEDYIMSKLDDNIARFHDRAVRDYCETKICRVCTFYWKKNEVCNFVIPPKAWDDIERLEDDNK